MCSATKTLYLASSPRIEVVSSNSVKIKSFFPINHYWAQYASKDPFGLGEFIESNWLFAQYFGKHPCSFHYITLNWIKGPEFLVIDTWAGLTYYDVKYDDDRTPCFTEGPMPGWLREEDLGNCYLGKLRPSKPVYIEAQLPPK